jgi:PTH1 family peptidyl-tRNA hydrolase
MFNKFKSFISPNAEGKPTGKPAGSVEYIIAGLGNPGREYENTRHNKSLYADTVLNGRRVLLLKPQTFMNSSGEAVRDAAAFYKVPLEKVIIIYDDVSLPVGKLRIRTKGTDGGHNGIKSIIYLTGKDIFPRIKIGVGQKPSPEYDLASWVLSEFPKSELEPIEAAIKKTYEAMNLIVEGKAEEAMNRYNS